MERRLLLTVLLVAIDFVFLWALQEALDSFVTSARRTKALKVRSLPSKLGSLSDLPVVYSVMVILLFTVVLIFVSDFVAVVVYSAFVLLLVGVSGVFG